MELNETYDQMNLIDIHRAYPPKTAEYTFFLRAHGTFSKIDHMLWNKVRLNKFKIEIISTFFSDHNSMTLEINYKKKDGEVTNMWRLKYTTEEPLDQWTNQRRNQKIPEDKRKWKDNKTTLMGCSKSNSKKEIHSNTSTDKQTRKIPNK